MEKIKYTFIEKKEHAIKLNAIKKRLSKLKIKNYAKEFDNIQTDMLYKVMNERAYSFDILNLIDERLTEIEKFVSDIEQVEK